jgi:hypothetical protein
MGRGVVKSLRRSGLENRRSSHSQIFLQRFRFSEARQ